MRMKDSIGVVSVDTNVLKKQSQLYFADSGVITGLCWPFGLSFAPIAYFRQANWGKITNLSVGKYRFISQFKHVIGRMLLISQQK